MHSNEKLKMEFIGKRVTIKKSTDPTWINKSGTIYDETKKTFIIDIDGTKKRVAKNTITFELTSKENKITINGSKIQYKPEERIKKTR